MIYILYTECTVYGTEGQLRALQYSTVRRAENKFMNVLVMQNILSDRIFWKRLRWKKGPKPQQWLIQEIMLKKTRDSASLRSNKKLPSWSDLNDKTIWLDTFSEYSMMTSDYSETMYCFRATYDVKTCLFRQHVLLHTILRTHQGKHDSSCHIIWIKWRELASYFIDKSG